MFQFKRYPHIAELLQHYIAQKKRSDIEKIYNNGIISEQDAEVFCTFIWDVVESIHSDSESENLVLGNADNTDMLPDLAYEITNHMKISGFYPIWEKSLSQKEESS